MGDSFSSDFDEIIADFLQESRDMIEQLEPTIIELGQSCQTVDCWAPTDCRNTACSRYKASFDYPCWLHKGYIGNGDQSCVHADNEEGCKKCRVFELTNGNLGTMNAIFRLFHSMKGSAGFLELTNISGVAHAAENLLDRIRSGKIKMESHHVTLLCQACDFAKEALDHVEANSHDKGMEKQAEEVKALLEKAVEDALQLVANPPGAGASKTQAQPAALAAAPQSAPEVEPCAKEIAAADAEQTEEQAARLKQLEDLSSLISPEMVTNFVQESDELLQRIEQGLLKWSENPAEAGNIQEVFRDVHSIKGNSGFFGFKDMEHLTHEMETVLDTVRNGGELALENPAEHLLGFLDIIRDGLSGIAAGGRGEIKDLDAHVGVIRALMKPKLGEVLVQQGVVDRETVAAALEAQNDLRIGETLVQMGKVTPQQVEEGLEEQKLFKSNAPVPPADKNKSNNAALNRQDIRVDLRKLDDLINMIGEMVIAENMLVNNPDLKNLELENFNKAAQQMGKIIRELQEMAMTIRMIPVSGLFKRMIRLVHDLSLKSGKKVELQLSGEETEVDKTVIETITDPLVHLLRNSLDHGLEPPEERIHNGKPDKGVVKLSARHEEGEVWITIEDDGRGLNREKILAKAREKGLIQGDGSDMPDKAIFNLIFMPGFSTADKITDVSGRGVGMDVVKQNLEKIKGKIEVQSRPNEGTKIKLRIPLTLAIIDGMMVRLGKTVCIAPLIAIREIIRPAASAITITPSGLEMVRIRDRFFPIKHLSDILGKPSDCEKIEDGILVLMEDQGTSFCLLVDEILGQQQTVIKGLSDYIGNVRGVSGCTILGNGEVCLILDVGSLVENLEFGEALHAVNA
ncbi:MAG: chemotaxis protein CheA [Deltaproteobacteria bacterium]|nr:chemotaxis protein CheA [Deltaproteobacteria bacterium]